MADYFLQTARVPQLVFPLTILLNLICGIGGKIFYLLIQSRIINLSHGIH